MRWLLPVLGLALTAIAAVQAPHCVLINSTLLETDQQPPVLHISVNIDLNFAGLPRAGSQSVVSVEGKQSYIATSGGHVVYGLMGGSVYLAGDPTPTDAAFNITILINYYSYNYDEYYVFYNCSGKIEKGTLAIIKDLHMESASTSGGWPVSGNSWSNAWTFAITAPYIYLPTKWYQGPEANDYVSISIAVREPRILSGLAAGQINSGELGVKAIVNSTELVLGDLAVGLPQDNPFKTSYSPSYFSWSPEGPAGVLSGSFSLTSDAPSEIYLKAWFVPKYWANPLRIVPPDAPGVVALRTSYILLNQTSEGRVALLDPETGRAIVEASISQWGDFPTAVSHLLAVVMPGELPSLGPFALSSLATGSGGWDYYNLYTYLQLPAEALWEPYVWLGSAEIWLSGGSLDFYMPQGGIEDIYTSLYGYLIYGGHYLQYVVLKYKGSGGYVIDGALGDNVAWNGAYPGALIPTEIGGFGATAVLTPWSFPAVYYPDVWPLPDIPTYGLAMMYSRWSYRSSPDGYVWASLIPSNYSLDGVVVDPVTGRAGASQGVVFVTPKGPAYPVDVYAAVLQPWPSRSGFVSYVSAPIISGATRSSSGRTIQLSGVVVWSLVPLVPCRSLYCVDVSNAWWNGQFVGNAALRGAAYGLAVIWLGKNPVHLTIYVNASGARYTNGAWIGSTWPSTTTYNISLGTFELKPYTPYLIVPGSAVPLPNATPGCALTPTPPGWILTPDKNGAFWVKFATPQGAGVSYYYIADVEMNYTISDFFASMLSPSSIINSTFCQLVNSVIAYPRTALGFFPSGCVPMRWLPLVVSQGRYAYWTAGCLNGNTYISGDLRPYGDLVVDLGSVELFRAEVKYIYIEPKIYINYSGIYIYVENNLTKFIKGYYFYLNRDGKWVLQYFCPGKSLYIPWRVALKLKAYPWDPVELVPAIEYSSIGKVLEYPIPSWSKLVNWWSIEGSDGSSDLSALGDLGCVKA